MSPTENFFVGESANILKYWNFHPEVTEMKKNSYLHRIDRSRVCPCNCVEHSEHDLGRYPVRLGLRFLPRLLRVPLCPARCREESCVRCCLGVLRRILGDRFNSRIARRERHHFRRGGVGCRFAAYRVLWAEIYHERLQRFLFRAHRFHAHSRTESYFDREKVCGGKSIKQQISIHGADRSAGLLFFCPAPKSRTFCRNS